MNEIMSENNRYFKGVGDFIDDVWKSKKTAGKRGWDTGLPVTDEILSYVKGYPTTVYSYAHQGKTQWVIEECVYLARKYGVISALYLTEAGSKGEALLDIAQTVLGKQAHLITDEELLLVIEWASKYFYFADVEEKFANVVEIFKEVRDLKSSGIDVQNVVIDHYHALEKHSQQQFMDRADNTKFVMKQIGRASKKFDVHCFMLFHVRDTDPVKCPTSHIWYLPRPEPYAISGGQQAGYLSYNMMSVWRPVSRDDHYGVINPITGAPYELNESIITCSKVKPKGAGRLGSRTIAFDVERQQYYCVYQGRRYYQGDYEGLPPISLNESPKPQEAPKKSWEDEEDLF
jgi:hypothetical protein